MRISVPLSVVATLILACYAGSQGPQKSTEPLPVPAPIQTTDEAPPKSAHLSALEVPEERSKSAHLSASPVMDFGPLDVGDVVPIEYLTADAAVVAGDGSGRVLILTENLDAGLKAGLRLPVGNELVTWVEVYPVKPPGKARIVKRSADLGGDFVIGGEGGEVVDVRIPNGWAPPTWLYDLAIPGTADPGPIDPVDPPPPAPELQELTDLSRSRADALGDAPTRAALKAEIGRMIPLIQTTDLAAAKAQMVMAIEDNVMDRREGTSQDAPWKPGWRTPVGNWINSRGDIPVTSYLEMMAAAASGL